MKLESVLLSITQQHNSPLVFCFWLLHQPRGCPSLGDPGALCSGATTTTMTDLKEEIRKALAFSKTPEGMEIARQHALKTAPKKRAKYRHSDETKVKMSINSGRRRAVWAGGVRYASISEAAAAEGISYANFQMRLNRGREGYRYA